MAPRKTENNTYEKFGMTKKEHYGMLWYFLEWSITVHEDLLPNKNYLERKLSEFLQKNLGSSAKVLLMKCSTFDTFSLIP